MGAPTTATFSVENPTNTTSKIVFSLSWNVSLILEALHRITPLISYIQVASANLFDKEVFIYSRGRATLCLSMRISLTCIQHFPPPAS